MPWLTPAACLSFVGPEKLQKLTLESGVVQPSTATADPAIFTTPFYGSSVVRAYDNAVEVSATLLKASGLGGRDQVLLASVPAGPVTVSSASGFNVDVLEGALVRAQGKVRGPVDAAGWVVPEDDATDVPGTLTSWVWDIAAWLLITDLRRSGLLNVYPEIAARYQMVCGEPLKPGELDKVTKGTFSLTGILSPESDDAMVDDGTGYYSSTLRVFANGDGVI
jgi:hypothetical protein